MVLGGWGVRRDVFLCRETTKSPTLRSPEGRRPWSRTETNTTIRLRVSHVVLVEREPTLKPRPVFPSLPKGPLHREDPVAPSSSARQEHLHDFGPFEWSRRCGPTKCPGPPVPALGLPVQKSQIRRSPLRHKRRLTTPHSPLVLNLSLIPLP